MWSILNARRKSWYGWLSISHQLSIHSQVLAPNRILYSICFHFIYFYHCPYLTKIRFYLWIIPKLMRCKFLPIQISPKMKADSFAWCFPILAKESTKYNWPLKYSSTLIERLNINFNVSVFTSHFFTVLDNM